MKQKLLLVVTVTLFLQGMIPHRAYADSIPIQNTCNNFNFMQAVMLYEGRGQSVLTKRFIGYAVMHKGLCFVDDSFYTNLRSVLRKAGPLCAEIDLDCQVEQFLTKFPADLREQAAVAADADLRDNDPPLVYHFDGTPNNPLFKNPKACPVARGWALEEPDNDLSRIFVVRTFYFPGDQTYFC